VAGSQLKKKTRVLKNVEYPPYIILSTHKLADLNLSYLHKFDVQRAMPDLKQEPFCLHNIPVDIATRFKSSANIIEKHGVYLRISTLIDKG